MLVSQFELRLKNALKAMEPKVRCEREIQL